MTPAGCRVPVHLPLVAQELMPHEQSGAQRASCVARRRLNPEVLERCLSQDSAVGDAIEGHAAGQGEVLHAGLLVDVPGCPQHGLLGDRLNGGGDIHFPLRQGTFRLAGRAAEEPVKLAIRHDHGVAVPEIVHVQPQRAVGLEVDQLLHDQIVVPGLAIRGQPHQLVLARIDLEPGEVREGGIEQAERMWEIQLVAQFHLVAAADAETGGGPFADAVHRQDGRLLKGRWEECAGRMRFVVFGEDIPALVAVLQGLVHLAGQVQLLLQPDRQTRQELAEAPRGVSQIGFQQPLEFEQGLLIEHDVVEFLRGKARGLEAVIDCVQGEAAVVLDSRESLLLSGRDDLAVAHEGRRTVMIEGRDSQDIHIIS